MRMAFITDNLLMKLCSLLVAVILFLFVNVESATPLDVDFRIEYRLGDDMMTIGNPPSVLHTTLEGPWVNLRVFDTDTLKPVVVDLQDAGPGTLRHRIDTKEIDPPAGVTVKSLNPTQIEVTLDRRVERQIPVEPDIFERPAFGYEILSVRIEPPRVKVVGPMSKMRTLDFINTRPLDVNGREDDLRTEVELRPPGPSLRLLERKVSVLVEIREEFLLRTFTDVKIELEHAPRGARVIPETANATLKGPQRVVDKLKSNAVVLFIDVAQEVEEGQLRFEKAVQLRNPPDRTLLVAPVPKVQIQLPRQRRRRR